MPGPTVKVRMKEGYAGESCKCASRLFVLTILKFHRLQTGVFELVWHKYAPSVALIVTGYFLCKPPPYMNIYAGR